MKRKKNMILCIFIVLLTLILSFYPFIQLSAQPRKEKITTMPDTPHNINQQILTMDNNPPNPPDITGPASGKINEEQKYTFVITDPDEDLLFNLEIKWGDGTESLDCGCGKSWGNGTEVIVYHQWKDEGTYNITARIQDSNGLWSEWSDPLPVTMPYSHKESLQQTNEYINISAQEAWDLMNNTEGGRQIPIDTRRPGEYLNERIIPPHFEDWPLWFPYELQSDGPGPIKNEGLLLDLFISHYNNKEIIIYCRTGRRTGLAAQILIDNGFQGKLYNMVDGITAWKTEGLPTTLTK